MNNYFLRAKQFRTKKRLGQNFLIDEKTIERIIEEVKPTDTILEIGAGAGFVTEQLVKHAKKVYAVEIDEDAIAELKKINAPNLTIIHNDILKTELKDVEDTTFKIIANIPYYITSPILLHLLGEIDDLNNDNRNRISEIILMVQYEVAQRIIANENSDGKQYGQLSILTQFYADTEIIKKVHRRAFYPAPKVDSALVKLQIRKNPIVKTDDYTYLRKTIKAAFSTRRKNIKNALMNGGFSREIIQQALISSGIEESIRAESLSIQKFTQLAQELKKYEKTKS